MKPCRNCRASRSGAARTLPAVPPAPQEATVHRYIHPIRITMPSTRSETEELLSYMMDQLSRQSEMLEELLRRTGGDNSDTI